LAKLVRWQFLATHAARFYGPTHVLSRKM
jgi:hypothetical protein